MTTTDTRLNGLEAIEYAERTGATLCMYTSPIEEAREGLTVEEAREIAAEDASLIYVEAVRCECGEAMGERCEWCGPESETVLVEWMPEHLRASHKAAGGRGVHPHNGSIRMRVERSCAQRLAKVDPDWTEIVG